MHRLEMPQPHLHILLVVGVIKST